MQSDIATVPYPMGARDLGFRKVTMALLIAGMYLHATHIIVGREIFLDHVTRPEFEWALSAAMLYSVVTGLAIRKRLDLPTRWRRIGYGVILGYFTVSVVVHAVAVVSGNSDYVNSFPDWYSYPIIAVMATIFTFVRSLRLRRDPRIS